MPNDAGTQVPDWLQELIDPLKDHNFYLEWFSGQLHQAYHRIQDFRDLDVNIKMHAMLKSRVPCPWYDDEVIEAMLDVTLPWGGQLSVAEVGGW